MRTASGAGWLVDQLPVGMLEDDFLVRFTSIFQDVADTLVESVDAIDASADLTVAPDDFVRWLGSWIDAYPHPGDGAQVAGSQRERAWIQAQAEALSGRGTRPSLQLMLQELCGRRPVRVTDGGGVYREGQCPAGDPAWVQVELPALADVAASDVLELIRAEVPVHVAVHLLVDGTPVGAVGDGAGGELDPTVAPEPAGTETGRPMSPRRLPGTAGRAGQPFRACPSCAERNRLERTECWRCGSPLLRPAPQPEPEPEPAATSFGPDPEPDEPRIWPVVLLLVVSALVLAGLVTGAALIW